MKIIKFFQFFMNLLNTFGKGIFLIPAMTLATFLIVFIVHRATGKHKVYKYLPGLILACVGLVSLYLGMSNLTKRSGLDRIWDFCIFFVSGFCGILFAWILGIAGKRTKKDTKLIEDTETYTGEDAYPAIGDQLPDDDRFGETRAIPKVVEKKTPEYNVNNAIYIDEIERLENKKRGKISVEGDTIYKNNSPKDDPQEDDFILPKTEHVTKDWKIWRKKK